MKKSLLALAALATVAGAASAQSSITMYGIADVGVVRESGNPSGPVTKVTSGVSAGSRLGFRGVEDLGGGMAALFTLETGISMDTGGAPQLANVKNPAGVLFARQSFVGLKSGAGTITLGRQYNPYFYTVNAIDPFGTGHEGNSGNIMAFTGSNGRSSNSIMYASPDFAGFKGELLYQFGEQIGNVQSGRSINGAISYSNGPLLVRLAANRTNNDTAGQTSIPVTKNNILGVVYDFKVVKMTAGYATLKAPSAIVYAQEALGFYTATPYRSAATVAKYDTPARTTTDVRDFLIGATIPVGPGNILASYIRRKDKTSYNQGATQAAIGYEYYLSKRTVWYNEYSRIRNDNGAGYTVGNAGDVTGGSGDKGFATGFRHTF